MNITAKQLNTVRYKNSNNTTANNRGASLSQKNNVNFGASPARIVKKIIDKKAGHTIYTNSQQLISSIDEIMGGKYFSKLLDTAKIDKNAPNLTIQNRTLAKDMGKTALTLVEIPLNIANSFCKKLHISLPDDSIIAKWAQKHEKEKAFDTACDILEEFTRGKKSSLDSFDILHDLITEPKESKLTRYKAAKLGKHSKEIDLDEHSAKFRNTISGNLTKVKKNYESRDERTLNRMATSTVSACFAYNDFYNISMLQKDDKEEATKSGKGRFKQEMSRMALNSALTYFTLGALDRYTKHNTILNASVIAGSSLISEIFSRLRTKTPLHPLSPQEAAKIAQNEEAKKTSTPQNSQTPTPNTSKQNVAFKGNPLNETEIFKNFTSSSGTILALEKLNSQLLNETSQDTGNTEEKPKKKSKMSKYITVAFVAANIAYLLAKLAKGDFKLLKNKLDFVNKYRSDISLGNITSEMQAAAKQISGQHTARSSKYSFIKAFEDKLTKCKNNFDLTQLSQEIEKIKATSEGQEIANILDDYQNKISCLKNAKNAKNIVSVSEDKFIIAALYKGIKRVFKTVYDFATIPALALTNGTQRIFKKDLQLFDKLNTQKSGMGTYKNELGALAKLCKISEPDTTGVYGKVAHFTKNLMRKINPSSETNNYSEIASEIAKRARNVEIGAETSDLANTSRTMVTIISTYFFVNDYRNRVLIESKGEDVEKANTEKNERLAHKISNFIINGTLMNTFNTLFNKWLNKSVLWATIIAACTEITNETLVRKSICQPISKKDSRKEIIDFETAQLNQKGPMGAWSKFYKKITGKKTLAQKAGINTNK